MKALNIQKEIKIRELKFQYSKNSIAIPQEQISIKTLHKMQSVYSSIESIILILGLVADITYPYRSIIKSWFI